MIISLIVAMDVEQGIGREGGIPWHLGTDLKRFKELTMGHFLVVGRKTFESIGRSLPGRTVIVVTRRMSHELEGCLVSHSLGQALALARESGDSEVFVAGGGDIFAQALPFADRIYLTEVHTRAACDVFFPEFVREEWAVRKSISHPADDVNDYAFTYSLLEKKDR
jgi:dihydrofolate reductase